MNDVVLDSIRRAADSAMQVQHAMFRTWTQPWSQPTGLQDRPIVGGADPLVSFSKSLSRLMTDLLNKHCENVDTHYRAAIRTIEESLQLGDAKDPEQYRRIIEASWRRSIDSWRSISEAQLRDSFTALEKWLEIVGQGTAAMPEQIGK